MKTIIAAVDFSEASRVAVHYAASLANSFNSELVIVHAINNEYVPGGTVRSDYNFNFSQDQLEGIVRRYTVKTRGVIRNGRPFEIVRGVALEENASLIVIGRKGKGESTSVFGSTTVEMIGKVNIPLLVVPEHTVYRTPQQITVTIDLNDYLPLSDFRVLNAMVEMFKPLIQVVNIQKPKDKLTPELIAAKSQSDREWSRYDYEYHIVRGNNIENTLADYLETHPTDLLAMVSRRKNLFEKIFRRSATRKMTILTKTPLLIMRTESKKK